MALAFPKPRPRFYEKPRLREKYRAARLAARKPCLHCGAMLAERKPCQAAQRRFCSTKCAYAFRLTKRKPCQVCGTPKPNSRLKTCSAACGYELRKRSLRSQRACNTCGRLYWPDMRIRTKFCSRKCADIERSKRPAMQATSCEMCGASFMRTAGALKRVRNPFCSQECSQKYNRGEKAGNWRGNANGYRGKGWARLAETIRKRDGYTCQRCTKPQTENKGYKLAVDHIIPWRAFEDKEQANHPSNLVSLCTSCHNSKTNSAERNWLKGDVIGMLQYRRSLKLKPLFATVIE